MQMVYVVLFIDKLTDSGISQDVFIKNKVINNYFADYLKCTTFSKSFEF